MLHSYQSEIGERGSWVDDGPSMVDEGSNSTFQKFPAETRVRIQLERNHDPLTAFIRPPAAGRRR